jgi:hypothetical protein
VIFEFEIQIHILNKKSQIRKGVVLIWQSIYSEYSSTTIVCNLASQIMECMVFEICYAPPFCLYLSNDQEIGTDLRFFFALHL